MITVSVRALIVVLAVLAGGTALAQEKVGILCLSDKGNIVVRTKCKSGETKLTVSQLSKKAPTGDTGPAGATGSLGRVIVFSEQPLTSALSVTGSVACPVGKTTLNGGCYTDSPFYLVQQSYPFDGSPNQWRCELTRIDSYNDIYPTSILRTYAICVDQ